MNFFAFYFLLMHVFHRHSDTDANERKEKNTERENNRMENENRKTLNFGQNQRNATESRSKNWRNTQTTRRNYLNIYFKMNIIAEMRMCDSLEKKWGQPVIISNIVSFHSDTLFCCDDCIIFARVRAEHTLRCSLPLSVLGLESNRLENIFSIARATNNRSIRFLIRFIPIQNPLGCLIVAAGCNLVPFHDMQLTFRRLPNSLWNSFVRFSINAIKGFGICLKSIAFCYWLMHESQ